MNKKKIEQVVYKHFSPSFFEVEDVSHLHKHGKSEESHYSLSLVDSIFEGMSFVRRQKLFFEKMKQEGVEVYSISMACYTPQEWEEKKKTKNPLPLCAGV